MSTSRWLVAVALLGAVSSASSAGGEEQAQVTAAPPPSSSQQANPQPLNPYPTTAQPASPQSPYPPPPPYWQPPYPQSPYPQPEYPPPDYYPPPGYYTYVPPPPPPPHRALGPPPWVNPPRFIRGRLTLEGFGQIMLSQSGGVEFIDHGGGFGISGGVDIGRWLGFSMSYSGSFHNPIYVCDGPYYDSWCGTNYMMLQTFGGETRLYIPTGIIFVPYAQVGGFGAWLGRSSYYADANGGGVEAGGGFDLWMSRTSSIGATVLYRAMWMKDYATYTGADTELGMLKLGFQFTSHF